MQAPPLTSDADWKASYAALLADHPAPCAARRPRRRSRASAAGCGPSAFPSPSSSAPHRRRWPPPPAPLTLQRLIHLNNLFAALLAGYAEEPPSTPASLETRRTVPSAAPVPPQKTWRTNSKLARTLLNAIPDLLFRMDVAGRLLDYKDAPGYQPIVPPAEFLGRNVADVLPPEVAAPMIAAARDACRTGALRAFEYRLLNEGQLRSYEARFARCAPDEVLLVVRNITASWNMAAALRESEERFRRLFENAAMGVVLVDPTGHIRDVNEAFCRFIGLPAPPCSDAITTSCPMSMMWSRMTNGSRA